MDFPATPANGRKTSPEDNRKYWLSYEGLTSENYFWQRLLALVSDSWKAYNAGDIERIEANLERIAWVEPMVKTEPYTSTYETGLVLATLPLAYAASNAFQIEKAYAIAQRCRDVLIGKRNRRREMGLAYRPDSECWYKLYTVLAELKWKGGPEFRNTVTTPENLVCDYLKIERRCLQFLEGNSSISDKFNTNVMYSLGWCGVQVIKMATQWCPQHVNVLIDDFNMTHGELLTRQAGHFLDSKPTDPRNPWYWDYELFKWCKLGPGTRDEANLCHQWRLDSMRSTNKEPADHSGFLGTLGRELEFLLEPQLQQQRTELNPS